DFLGIPERGQGFQALVLGLHHMVVLQVIAGMAEAALQFAVNILLLAAPQVLPGFGDVAPAGDQVLVEQLDAFADFGVGAGNVVTDDGVGLDHLLSTEYSSSSPSSGGATTAAVSPAVNWRCRSRFSLSAR